MSDKQDYTLKDIELLCRRFAERETALADKVAKLKADVHVVQRQHVRGLKVAAAQVAEAENDLEEAVKAAPELFKRPKSRTLHGVKCGYRKNKGTTKVVDEEKTIKLSRKLYPDECEAWIVQTETVSKAVLQNQPTKVLKAIGVHTTKACDVPFVQSIDSELEKFVKALVDEASKDAETSGDGEE